MKKNPALALINREQIMLFILFFSLLGQHHYPMWASRQRVEGDPQQASVLVERLIPKDSQKRRGGVLTFGLNDLPIMGSNFNMK